MAEDEEVVARGTLDWNFALTQRPDGKHWILIQIITDLTQFAFALPPEAVPELMEQFPKLLKDLAQQAHVANGGLTVASADVLTKLKGKK